jgi:hypothetical protein
MRIEFSDHPGEHNAGTIVEVARVIGLNDVINNIKKTSSLTTFFSGITGMFAILALEAAMLPLYSAKENTTILPK